uniref:Coiled-coil domain-containing protein 170 n=1 Tax=Haemonchus contortus TaxID=6289 RepID=A0A7I4YBV4_HAECO
MATKRYLLPEDNAKEVIPVLVASDREELRLQISRNREGILTLNNEISKLRIATDAQIRDLIASVQEGRSGAKVDVAKMANSTQQMDSRMKDLTSQIHLLGQTLKEEREDRTKRESFLLDKIARLQDSLREHNGSQTEAVMELLRKSNADKAKLSEENKRLHGKMRDTVYTISQDMANGQKELKNEISKRLSALESSFKSQTAKCDKMDSKVTHDIAGKLRAQEDRLDALSKKLLEDQAIQKSRLQKIGVALEALEKKLESDRNKFGTTLDEEVQRRKLHEKVLLSRIGEVEGQLLSYVENLKNSMRQIKNGNENVEIPSLDTDSFRRELETIAADKSKMNANGLLLLEQRMASAQKEVSEERKKLSQELGKLAPSDQVNELRHRLENLSNLSESMKKIQDKMMVKIDKQLPKELSNISDKTDNITQHLLTRLKKEEEERFFAIKELQEAFQKLQNQNKLVEGDLTSFPKEIWALFPSKFVIGPISNSKFIKEQREHW